MCPTANRTKICRTVPNSGRDSAVHAGLQERRLSCVKILCEELCHQVNCGEQCQALVGVLKQSCLRLSVLIKS